MYLIEILLPMSSNRGEAFPSELYENVRRELTKTFGGVTAFARAPAEGIFAADGKVQRDDIAIFEVMAEALDKDWWRTYRAKLEQAFAQDEIVVRASHITRL